MSTTLPPATPADGMQDAELDAAIRKLPTFIRSPIFMPTERMPIPEAIEGLERVRDLYAFGLDATYRPRLRALKAARQHRRCFVIGNGPSLARTDLARLKSEATFATNGFFLKLPELDWSPTYYVVEDHLVGEDRAPELNALGGTTKLFPASLAYALRPDRNTIYFDHRPRKSFPDGFDFSFDADVNTYTGGTVTYTCLQLAAYLGYQEIYLIGVDADYAIPADAALSGSGPVKQIDMGSDDPNHFHPDYFGKGKRWHEPNVDVMLGAYAEARRATETRGVSIVNATVGGKLEVFPRIDYEVLFRPAPAERLLVIDHTQIGNGTASGEVKRAILDNWPSDRLMQLYDKGQGRLRLAGGPISGQDESSVPERIAAFEPDVILYRPVPGRDALHAMAMGLIERTDLPLAVWIVDDWPSDHATTDPIQAARLEADFRWLLARADAHFSISTAMSTAFHERYGYPFVPIANGVDPADWPPGQRRPPGPVVVRYAGNLAENMTLGSVQLVAQAVEALADGGVDISLEIKSHKNWRWMSKDWIEGLRHTSMSASNLSPQEYRRWLSEADILLIAYNFDDRSRDYIRYSVANKLPECLASGTAVLAVGPDDIGTIATMATLDVGQRVGIPDEQVIRETLRQLAASPALRFDIAQRAQEVAFSLFAVSQPREAFEATVARATTAHRAGDHRHPERSAMPSVASSPSRPAGAAGASVATAGVVAARSEGEQRHARPAAHRRFSAWLKPRAPGAHRVLRLARRAALLLWRRRSWTIPAGVILALWILAGFAPPLAPVSGLIWGSAGLALVTLPMLYAIYRLHARTQALTREITRLHQLQRADARRASEAFGQLDRSLADAARANAELQEVVARLEAADRRDTSES